MFLSHLHLVTTKMHKLTFRRAWEHPTFLFPIKLTTCQHSNAGARHPLLFSLSLHINSNPSFFSPFALPLITVPFCYFEIQQTHFLFCISVSLSLTLHFHSSSMKFLSFSSSVSSTTTAPFDANLCNSKNATAGCLAGVLRRLLCSNSLPTYPSDQIRDPDTNSLSCLEKEGKVTNTEHPGVVARLMGLESMPKFDLGNTQVTPNSISRSRSMNSVDSGKELESMQRLHRRVKTSLSFREMPTFLELENEEFLVLSFENGGKTKESRSKAKRSGMGGREMKTRKTDICKNNRRPSENELESQENQEPNNVISDVKVNRRINHKPTLKISNNGKVKDSANILLSTKNSNGYSHIAVEAIKQSKPINHRQNSGEGKSRRKKEKKENMSMVKKVQAESDSENSSPVSVLYFGESTIDPEAHTSEEDSRLTVSNSRRKLSTELENYEHSSLSNTNNSASNDPKAKVFERKCNGSRKKDVQIEDYSDIWFEICKMAERELHESKWVYREMWKLEDFEERVADLASQVIEELLNELVDQLAFNSPLKRI